MSETEQFGEYAAIRLTDDERLKVSAVVHQNYYMPDVFEVVEQIVAERLVLAAVEAKRGDTEFMARVRDRVTQDAPTLLRLGDPADCRYCSNPDVALCPVHSQRLFGGGDERG